MTKRAEPVAAQTRAPTDAENAARASALDYLRNMAGHFELKLHDKLSRADVPVLQTLYDAVGRSNVDVDQAAVALGVGFGEALSATGRFSWIHVTDELGAQQCLKLKGHQFWVSPISMVRQRLAAREEANLDQLYAQTLSTVDEAARQFSGAAT